MPRIRELPLLIKTPEIWATNALKDPLTLLNDHAHLERKAALNALELVPRWPEEKLNQKWINVLGAVARDEVQHFGQVIKLLEKRGGKLSKAHKSSYAQGLRSVVRLGRANEELVDRLLVSALIEARSCERFQLLADVCEEDIILKKFYRALWASEHGHYTVFLALAKEIRTDKEELKSVAIKKVEKRWAELLEQEAKIVSSEANYCGIHSWV